MVITGASSGLGLAAAKALGQDGDWHVIMACRDFSKAARAAQSQGIPKENYTIMHLDLAAFDSVRQFVDVSTLLWSVLKVTGSAYASQVAMQCKVGSCKNASLVV